MDYKQSKRKKTLFNVCYEYTYDVTTDKTAEDDIGEETTGAALCIY